MSRITLPDDTQDYDQEGNYEERSTITEPKLFSTIMHLVPRGTDVCLDCSDELELLLKKAIANDAKLMRYLSDQIEVKLMEKNLISYESIEYLKPVPDYIDVAIKLRVYPNS